MKVLVLLAACAVLPTQATEPEPVIVGHTITVPSEILSQDRRVHIYLPEDYETATGRRYPVIYAVGETRGFKEMAGMLDGLTHYRPIMPPVILVVLATVAEDGKQIPVYDMTPNSNADTILRFVETELIPYIDKNYRTHPYRILEGGGLTAVFGLYTLMKRPGLFKAHVAATPYLFRDDSALITMASEFFKREQELPTFLYLSIDDERLRDYYDSFIEILEQQAPPTLDWHSVEFPGDRQPTVRPWVDAMYRLFKNQRLSTDSTQFEDGAESIYAYYRKLSTEKYGYPISAEIALHDRGLAYLEADQPDVALRTFAFAVDKYPHSAMLYDGMARVLDKTGDLDAAISAQETAVSNAQAGRNYGDINGVNIYQGRLDELRAEAGS